MFLFCELGESVSDHFNLIPNVIYYLDWYTFPKDIQKMIPTIMMVSQQPIVLQAFASLKCTREAFKQVMKLII